MLHTRTAHAPETEPRSTGRTSPTDLIERLRGAPRFHAPAPSGTDTAAPSSDRARRPFTDRRSRWGAALAHHHRPVVVAIAAIIAAVAIAGTVVAWVSPDEAVPATTPTPVTQTFGDATVGPRVRMGWPCPYSPSPDVAAFKDWYCAS